MDGRSTEICDVLFGLGVDSQNRLDVMLNMLPYEPDQIFWSVFAEGWSACDDTWDMKGRLLGELRRRNKNGSPWRKDWFDSLPDEFKIYRGGNLERSRGLSWTINPDVAASFAQGHRGTRVPDPVIASATIKKKSRAILFATNDRDEQELLVDCGRLKNVLLTPAADLATFTKYGRLIMELGRQIELAG